MTATMTSRYTARFEGLKAEGRHGFIPFTLLGWPDVETSKRILKTMVEAKPAALELGLPFSDPIADGPVIQQAVSATLANGFRMDQGFELIEYARSLDAELPIGLLVYFNTILAQGVEGFFEKLKAAGGDAVLIADLPPEMAEQVSFAAKANHIELIFMVSPLTTSDRLDTFVKQAGAFIYVVSRLGITGAEERYDESLADLLSTLKAKTDLPLCVGFGISTPAQARQMIELGADGVITGSALINCVTQNQPDFEKPLSDYLLSMT